MPYRRGAAARERRSTGTTCARGPSRRPARAYAPYSRLHVGVAALTDDGRLLQACNVENASYGLGLCAECGLVSALHASGGGLLVALACRSGAGDLLMPCGRCRQLLWEHGGPELLVDTPARRPADDRGAAGRVRRAGPAAAATVTRPVRRHPRQARRARADRRADRAGCCRPTCAARSRPSR